MPTLTFSIIIASYNYAHLLPRAIDSALVQTCTDYEVIVVDDGSTDNTPEVVQPYLDKIQYHRQENKGHCATNNKGVSLASGKYCYFLDADDVWLPNKLAPSIIGAAWKRVCFGSRRPLVQIQHDRLSGWTLVFPARLITLYPVKVCRFDSGPRN